MIPISTYPNFAAKSMGSNNNTTIGLSLNPNFTAPTVLRRRRSSSSSRKQRTFASPKSTSRSIEEMRKVSFNNTVLKSDGGGVRDSSFWVKSHLLGRGSYGSVYLATSKNKDKDKKVVAIKSSEISHASSLIDEHRILTRLSCPFVVGCYGYEIIREKTLLGCGKLTNYNLILEYCSVQTIFDLIESNGRGLPDNEVRVFVSDIIFGLLYLCRENIIHCDIKPENIILSPIDNQIRSNGFLTKIGDFGLAMEKGSADYGNGSGHRRGTTRYKAPKLISHGIVDFGVDIWALGCTVLEMLTGQSVWSEHDIDDLGNVEDWVDLIGYSSFIPHVPDWLSEEARDFLRRCLVRDPSSRWEIGSLIKHPFFLFGSR